MNSLRKWMFKPKRSDKAHLAQFYYADEELNIVASELDSFDGRKDPERCTSLVNKLRHCQDAVLTIVEKIMIEVIPDKRATRDYRVKYPDEVSQDSLAGQLWFGAECLAAGSSIMNREIESASMRPLARVVTNSIDHLRSLLRDQCLRNLSTYTNQIRNALIEFDQAFAEFELSYVSAMVPVKTMKEYDLLQEVTVLFCETVERALQLGLLSRDTIESFDPALMITIPRLAIVCGLLLYPDGPLNPDKDPMAMCEIFRQFQVLLYKIRELLWTLSSDELRQLEQQLCSHNESQPINQSLSLLTSSAHESLFPSLTPIHSRQVTQDVTDIPVSEISAEIRPRPDGAESGTDSNDGTDERIEPNLASVLSHEGSINDERFRYSSCAFMNQNRGALTNVPPGSADRFLPYSSNTAELINSYAALSTESAASCDESTYASDGNSMPANHHDPSDINNMASNHRLEAEGSESMMRECETSNSQSNVRHLFHSVSWPHGDNIPPVVEAYNGSSEQRSSRRTTTEVSNNDERARASLRPRSYSVRDRQTLDVISRDTERDLSQRLIFLPARSTLDDSEWTAESCQQLSYITEALCRTFRADIASLVEDNRENEDNCEETSITADLLGTQQQQHNNGSSVNITPSLTSLGELCTPSNERIEGITMTDVLDEQQHVQDLQHSLESNSELVSADASKVNSVDASFQPDIDSNSEIESLSKTVLSPADFNNAMQYCCGAEINADVFNEQSSYDNRYQIYNRNNCTNSAESNDADDEHNKVPRHNFCHTTAHNCTVESTSVSVNDNIVSESSNIPENLAYCSSKCSIINSDNSTTAGNNDITGLTKKILVDEYHIHDDCAINENDIGSVCRSCDCCSSRVHKEIDNDDIVDKVIDADAALSHANLCCSNIAVADNNDDLKERKASEELKNFDELVRNNVADSSTLHREGDKFDILVDSRISKCRNSCMLENCSCTIHDWLDSVSASADCDEVSDELATDPISKSYGNVNSEHGISDNNTENLDTQLMKNNCSNDGETLHSQPIHCDACGSANCEHLMKGAVYTGDIGKASELSNIDNDLDWHSDSCSSITDTYSSGTSSDEEDGQIQRVLQAAETSARQEARSHFRTSNDLIHRLFVCISGVADQLQTNYASDLRHILQIVFEYSLSNESSNESIDVNNSITTSNEIQPQQESTSGENESILDGESDSTAMRRENENLNRPRVELAAQVMNSAMQNVTERSYGDQERLSSCDADVRGENIDVIRENDALVTENIDVRGENDNIIILSDNVIRNDDEGEGSDVDVAEDAFIALGNCVVPSTENVSPAVNWDNGNTNGLPGPQWIPDNQSTQCASCRGAFTFVRRRHHCRNCGMIFCSQCSSNAVPLPQFGHTKPVRVCNHCFLSRVPSLTIHSSASS